MNVQFWLVFYILLLGFLLFSIGLLPTAFIKHKLNISEHLLSGIHIISVGFVAWPVFWAFWADANFGKLFVKLIILTSVISLPIAIKTNWMDVKPLLRTKQYIIPLLLSLLISFIYLMHVSSRNASVEHFPETISNAILVGLPNDNILPQLFAQRLYSAEPISPIIEDWLASDRPPLQTAMILLQHMIANWFNTRDLGDGVMGVLCQTSFFCGLWALIAGLGLSSTVKKTILFMIPAIGFIFLNSLFTWPKLFSAGFILTATALLISQPITIGTSALVGIASALGILSHGGVVFTLLPLLFLFSIRALKRRQILPMATTFFTLLLVYSPWIIFQKIIDPPGDRLIKWHIGGVPEVNNTPALETIINSYRANSWRDIIDSKISSLEFIFGPFSYNKSYFEALFAGRRDLIKSYEFFHPFLSLSLSVIGFVLWRKRKDALSTQRSNISFIWLLAILSTFFWWLLMWGRYTTSSHQGSYATLLLFLVLLGNRIGEMPSVFRNSFLILNFAWFCWIWLFNLPSTRVWGANLYLMMALTGVIAYFYFVTRLTTTTPKETNSAESLVRL